MNYFTLCFVLQFTVRGILPSDIEEQYQKTFKKIFSYLYAHKKLSLSVFIPGQLLEWFEKKHPEIIDVLSDLVKRKQVEILGGGYYEPPFPLLLPYDRVGQIELLTTTIRKTVGKRPRGITMAESIWDPSMITSCNSCGIEYALLDYRLIPKSTFKPVTSYSPLIVEDLGRTLTVIPIHQDYLPTVKKNPSDFFAYLKSVQNLGSSFVSASLFTPEELIELIETGWMSSFLEALTQEKAFQLSIPLNFLKECDEIKKTFIPAGCMSDAAMWTLEPFVPHSKVFSEAMRPTVRDFLNLYPEAQKLYSRMMNVGLMVSQCRGDKVRKKAASGYLWAAQNYAVYLFTGKGGITDKHLRQHAYKNLLSAEKLVREATAFVDNTTSFDFNFDGNREYVNRFSTYNAFITRQGGMITELDIMHNCTNYCDVMPRIRKYDGVTDLYAKNMFVDHFISTKKNEKLEFNSPLLPDFTQQMYTQKHFEHSRHEVILETSFYAGKSKQKVGLTKKFLLNENGILVQYILKNLSSDQLNGYFAVENNFSIPQKNGKNIELEVLVNDHKETPEVSAKYLRQDTINLLQLTDVEAKNSFVLTPNEKAGLLIQPLTSSKPDEKSSCNTQHEATTCTFFWKISIPAGMESEKTLNMAINTSKKKSVAKRKRK